MFSVLNLIKARDERAAFQKHLIEKYHYPVISFTLNIAGSEKRNPKIDIIFNFACQKIEKELSTSALVFKEQLILSTGNTAYYVYEESSLIIKKILVDLEESCDIGRLYDMDVIDNQTLSPIKRSEVYVKPRKCLVCKTESYLICRCNKTHLLKEVIDATNDLINKEIALLLSTYASFSLSSELATTPKPGLVDRNNNGSHKDMDYRLFQKSVKVITPYLKGEFLLALDGGDKLELFIKMKNLGMIAEKEMFIVTSGINTHKGAFFSFSIMGCAICYILSKGEEVTIEKIRIFSHEFSSWAMENNVKGNTHGDYVRKTVDNCGIFSEATLAYPSIFNNCNKYLELFNTQELSNYFFNLSSQKTFDLLFFEKNIEPTALKIMITLMGNVNDSNILYRGGRSALDNMNILFKQLESESDSLIDLKKALVFIDQKYIGENLSPGGCADLLALTIFVLIGKSVSIIKLT